MGSTERGVAQTASMRCGPGGYLGDLVLKPNGAKDSRVTVKVVVGLDTPASACSAATAYQGCIVARRWIRYVPRTPLRVGASMVASCLNVPCTESTTCAANTLACVPADVDPGDCEGAAYCEPPGTRLEDDTGASSDAGARDDAGSGDGGSRAEGGVDGGTSDDCPGSQPKAPWPTAGRCSDRRGRGIGPGLRTKPALKWSVDLTRTSEPVIAADGTIYVTASPGLTAVSPDGVAKQVATAIDPGPNTQPSIAANGSIYVHNAGGTQDRHVLVYTPATDTLDLIGDPAHDAPEILMDPSGGLWDIANVGGVPRVHRFNGAAFQPFDMDPDGNAYTMAISPRTTLAIALYSGTSLVHGFDATSRLTLSNPFPDGSLLSYEPVFSGDTIFLAHEATGSGVATLYGLREDLTKRWSADIGPDAGRMAIASDGSVVVSSFTGSRRLAAATGDLLWSGSTVGGAYLSISADDILYTVTNTWVTAYDLRGSPLQIWRLDAPSSTSFSTYPAVIGADGTLYVVTQDSRLQAYR
jgi:hypothetical protein